MSENDLKPEKAVFRFLFASPTHFVGECSGEGFYLAPVFPSFGRRSSLNQYGEGSAFSLSIRVDPPKAQTIRVETYEWVGEEVSALLGGFFGKLVLNRGHIQSGSVLTVPSDYGIRGVRDDNRSPFNKERRKPSGPELNLHRARTIVEHYIELQGEQRVGWILRAAEFYRMALESFHARPEIALALFCSTLEALLPLREYSPEEMYDAALVSKLKEIEEHCPNGRSIAADFRSRLFQIKRRVVAFVDYYIDDDFFSQRETKLDYAVVKDKSELLSRIKCVYDLRSNVLHTGDRSGLWYIEHDHQNSEIGLGSPVMDDRKLKRTLTGALTLTGLERVTSAILRAVIFEWAAVGTADYPMDESSDH